MDDHSLAHSKYNCTYHIVFIPKYRRKIMYGEVRTEIGEIIKYICKLEGVELSRSVTMNVYSFAFFRFGIVEEKVL